MAGCAASRRKGSLRVRPYAATLVGGVLHHLADRPAVPAAVAGSGENAIGTQTAHDRAHGESLAPNPVEDLADHARFIEDDRIVRQVRSLPFADIAIAIGRMHQSADRSTLG